MVERDGEVAAANEVAVAEDGYPACPACGCEAAPVEGQCSDCGLQLE
jgi:hypothetical protein